MVRGQQLGKPYIWGASGPDSFDWSGFAEWALRQLDLAPPERETAAGLHDYFTWTGRGVSITTAQVGLADLCFYRNAQNHIDHITLSWRDGEVIEAGKGRPDHDHCRSRARAGRRGNDLSAQSPSELLQFDSACGAALVVCCRSCSSQKRRVPWSEESIAP